MKIKVMFFALVAMCISFESALAQPAETKIEVNLFLSPQITNAQSISMTDLNISSTGQGANIMTLRLQNLLDEKLEDLFLYIMVESSEDGLLAEFDQVNHRPFSMTRGQIAQGNNNQFESGIPGLSSITLDGDVTDEALSIVGQGVLPAGVYTARVAVYQGGNRLNNGVLVGEDIAEFVIEASSDERDIIMLIPGAPVGEEAVIQTDRPFFSWTGGGSDRYRLIVVEESDSDSPESMLNQALLSQPQQNLDFKMLDRELVGQSQLTYPGSGAQALRPGVTYFWQVSALIQTPGGTDVRSSEIWQFRIATPGQAGGGETEEPLQEILASLELILDDEDISRILSGGFRLESVMLENITLRNQQAIISTLLSLQERIEAGEIEIID